MKPYLLVTGDFVRTGGMDRANHALAHYLAERGNEVHLVAFRVEDDLLRRSNVIHHRVPKPANSYMIGLPLLARAGRTWAHRIADRGGRVIVNGGSARWNDINWVHYLHAAYRPHAGPSPLRKIVDPVRHRRSLADERRALLDARIVIANSIRTKCDLIQLLHLPEDRIHVIYHGVDPDTFHPADPDQRNRLRVKLNWPSDRRIALFIGALSDRRKGFDTLFEAWSNLCRDDAWDVDLFVIGAGRELDHWRDRAGDANLSHRIRIMGFRRDVPDLLRAADLLVSPTRYEAYGLAVHEALCCGIPAIVSASAGVAERFPAALQHLLLQSPEDASELAERLRNWRRSRDADAHTIAELSQTLRRQTWHNMAEQFMAKIESPAPAPSAKPVPEPV